MDRQTKQRFIGIIVIIVLAIILIPLMLNHQRGHESNYHYVEAPSFPSDTHQEATSNNADQNNDTASDAGSVAPDDVDAVTESTESDDEAHPFAPMNNDSASDDSSEDQAMSDDAPSDEASEDDNHNSDDTSEEMPSDDTPADNQDDSSATEAPADSQNTKTEDDAATNTSPTVSKEATVETSAAPKKQVASAQQKVTQPPLPPKTKLASQEDFLDPSYIDDDNSEYVKLPTPGELHSNIQRESAEARKVMKGQSSPATVAPAKEVASMSTTEAWVVQMGMFSQKANADDLVAKLRQKHFNAFIVQTQANGQTFSRVYVGPMKDQAKTADLKKELAEEVGIHGFVRSYTVTHS